MEKSIKINIGSGPQGKPDWVNLDWGMLPILSKIPFSLSLLTALRVLPKSYNQPWQSNPRLCDCRRCLPFKSESVDYIYSSHFVEHLMRYQALDLFNECKRILKPEGVMRISVPDLKIFTEKYLSRDLKFFKGI
ncbi:MAG: class I SAM-dependent methyltransferase, partial [Deltaproteobacteria bacterium]